MELTTSWKAEGGLIRVSGDWGTFTVSWSGGSSVAPPFSLSSTGVIVMRAASRSSGFSPNQLLSGISIRVRPPDRR